MKTKEQLANARGALSRCVWPDGYHEEHGTAIVALAAYERVTALRDDMRAKADRDLSGTHTHFANLLDRALEG